MVKGKPLPFGHFWPIFQLVQNGSKRPKMTSGVLENDSKVFSLFFWSVFKKFKRWLKLTKMVRGKPLLFRHFWSIFQLVQNRSKRLKMTSGVVEIDSKVFSLRFWSVLKKFKKWPKLTKMVRGKPLLFGHPSPTFQLFQNGSKRAEMTSGVAENNPKVFSLRFWSVFKKFKKWAKLTKMLRDKPYFFAIFGRFFNSFKTAQKGLKWRLECLKMIQKCLAFVSKMFLNSSKGGQNWPKW